MKRLAFLASYLLTWTFSSLLIAEPSFEKLKAEILKRQIKTTAELLDFFNSTPEYRAFTESPVLEESSGAIHGNEATAKFPRIMLRNGNMAMHFIGDPKSP